MVDFLLNDCQANPNATDYNGDSPLHDAARFGHLEIIHALLNAVSPNPLTLVYEGRKCM